MTKYEMVRQCKEIIMHRGCFDDWVCSKDCCVIYKLCQGGDDLVKLAKEKLKELESEMDIKKEVGNLVDDCRKLKLKAEKIEMALVEKEPEETPFPVVGGEYDRNGNTRFVCRDDGRYFFINELGVETSNRHKKSVFMSEYIIGLGYKYTGRKLSDLIKGEK